MKSAPRRSLGLRLTIAVVASAFVVSIVLVGGVSLFHFRAELDRISDDAQMIEVSTVPEIVEALLGHDTARVRRDLESVLTRKHVASVELKATDMSVQLGDPTQRTLVHRYTLPHPVGGMLGEMVVWYDRASAYRSVRRQSLSVIGFVLIAIAAVALITLILFRRMIARPIQSLADQARTLTVDTLDRHFRIGDSSSHSGDELGGLLAAIEHMRTNLSREISERKTAELRLDETQRRYREVFDATGDGIIVHDALTGRIVEVNRTTLDMYGYTSGEIARLSISDLTAEDDRCTGPGARHLLSLAATGQPQLYEWRARRKDGTAFWVEISLKRMEPTAVNRVLAVVRDVAVRKSFEERRLQTQKMETLGQLAGGVAHDVNNVLGAILATAEQVPRLHDRQELLTIVDTIRTTCKRGADLTGRLLSFSRDGPRSAEPVDVRQVIRDAAEILSHSFDKRVVLTLDLPADDCWVTGDAAHLENAILNLGLNARDAMPDGGRLTIFCRVRRESDGQNWVTVRVEDTGIGMDRTAKEHAFEPFYTNKPVGEGTGLGLASVYSTVQDHAGTVDIQSKVGEGTVVSIDIPMVDAPTVDVQAVGDVDAASSAGLLIIDDEEVLRTMTAQILTHAGHQVSVAADGVEGVDLYCRKRGEIDLVIVDMIMPRMSGDAVFHAIREMDPDANVLLATGFADGEVVDELIADGMAGIITKPYSKNDLIGAVNRALG